MNKPVSNIVLENAVSDAFWDVCSLTYDQRFLRRRVLETAGQTLFLVDLAKTTSVKHGDAFVLTDGRLIQIHAAAEDLLDIRGGDLVRLAWHVGNRHTPCQIEADRLVIQRDHVIRKMLEGLGAEVTEISEPFMPEGGAYGHGRTMGHDHGHRHGHRHGQDGGHSHAHAH